MSSQLYQSLNPESYKCDFMKTPALLAIILILLISSSMASAGQSYSYRERVIICMLALDYADAEQLADVLTPFLSHQGKISAYSPTNTLIIKDQPSVVKMLIKAIKGRAELSDCKNFDHIPVVGGKSNGS
jgi:type II secretory pathway component GspD/PulD (secretin)